VLLSELGGNCPPGYAPVSRHTGCRLRVPDRHDFEKSWSYGLHCIIGADQEGLTILYRDYVPAST